MRKISLDVDALEVESFATAERGAEKRGTVHGHSFPLSCLRTRNDPTCDEYCYPQTVEGEYTCGQYICNTDGGTGPC